MPIYEYGCSSCGKRSSALLPIWSAPDPPCAHCGSGSVRRMVSTFAAPRSGFGSELDHADFGEDAYDGGDGGFGDAGGGFGDAGGGFGDEGGDFDDF
ncbi:MAG TPA: zinc ribbon domain-containing protein [Candidatus Dormibacteraeota bacterium]|nr:zinc ribbon domain-containing protein [Candidatus Dormibacteraeota bacterium]